MPIKLHKSTKSFFYIKSQKSLTEDVAIKTQFNSISRAQVKNLHFPICLSFCLKTASSWLVDTLRRAPPMATDSTGVSPTVPPESATALL